MDELNNISIARTCGLAKTGLRKMSRFRILQFASFVGMVGVLAACGASQGGQATDQFNRCRAQEKHGDATGCWHAFLEEYRWVASSSEIAYAEDHSGGAREPGDDPPPGGRRTGDGTGSRMTPACEGCSRGFSPTGNSRNDVVELGRRCGGPCGLEPFSDIKTGSQRSSDNAQDYTIQLRSGQCYVFFAVGGRGIEDLDTGLRDPDGAIVIKDTGDDAWPMFPYCAERSGRYEYVVSVASGSGQYHFQVWEGRR